MRTLGVEVVDVGGLKLTEFLKEQMQRNNINFRSLYTARTLKEVCHFLPRHILKLYALLNSVKSQAVFPFKILRLSYKNSNYKFYY
jgi:hypothetical protein